MDEKLISLERLIGEPSPPVAVLANASAYLNQILEDVSWLGFYLTGEKEPEVLYLGPFQGKPACIWIPFGRGVCGVSAAEKRTVIVPDVRRFPGYISCDALVRSEIVVPMLRLDGYVLGVLDIDSDSLNRFGREDAALLRAAARVIAERLEEGTGRRADS